MPATSNFFGGMAVMMLFAGQVWLLGLLSDRFKVRAKALETANPGQAHYKAEQQARTIGILVLKGAEALSWFAGLVVLPWLCVIIYDGSWAMLPLEMS